MTRPPDIAEIGAVALTAAYNVALNRHLPEAAHLPANLAASGALLLLARRAGVGVGDLGLAPEAAGVGVLTGLAVAVGVAGAVVVGAAFPTTRRFFVDETVRDRSTAELTYHALLRIPIATALGEELVFRAALLGLFGRGRTPGIAIAVSSGLFGLWHILPTLDSLEARQPAPNPPGVGMGSGVGRRTAGRAAIVAGVVVATAGAGAAFAALRLRSRSILTPAVAHATLNVAAMLAARVVSRPGSIRLVPGSS
jgi:uncharacterized protein